MQSTTSGSSSRSTNANLVMAKWRQIYPVQNNAKPSVKEYRSGLNPRSWEIHTAASWWITDVQVKVTWHRGGVQDGMAPNGSVAGLVWQPRQ